MGLYVLTRKVVSEYCILPRIFLKTVTVCNRAAAPEIQQIGRSTNSQYQRVIGQFPFRSPDSFHFSLVNFCRKKI